ncbi:MAG: hypothetical protein NT165_02240 [Candidatus Falkowbacteria bacterium]|nr:hypothetical protein [Candidatus Falkowbacteria bacterium]
MANLKDAFGSSIKTFADKSGYQTGAEVQPEVLVGSIIQTVLQFLGVAFLGLVIYGGIIWMTGSGNEDNVKRAKKIITAAVIGLVIVVLAYAISTFVIQNILQNKIRNI